jgi:DNA-binding GntR family transcriptional regulator
MLRQKVRIGLTSLAQNPTDPTRLKNALTEARRLLEAMASLSVCEREAIEQFLACLELLAAGEPAVSLDELMRKVETLGNSH